jgi:hypothetical protein
MNESASTDIAFDLKSTRPARGRAERSLKVISISFPFGGVIPGVSGVFRGLARRRGIARELPENPDSLSGGPNGIRTRVSALRGPCPRPLDDGAGRASTASCLCVALRENEKWLGEEGSNPHYQGQNLASYH